MNNKALLTALAIPALGMLTLRVDAGAPEAYKIGDKIANFALKDDTGTKISLSRYKGKVVVINFYGFN